VAPAAVVSSLLGLAVFYGSLVLSGAQDAATLEAAAAEARTAFTSFLVLAGLALIVFVEPPTDWLAVAEPRSRDRRPTYLAAALAAGYAATLVLPAARDFFSFAVPQPLEGLLVLAAFAAWVPLVRLFWKRRLLERFVGLRAAS
jgi:cation-transporting ATPase E